MAFSSFKSPLFINGRLVSFDELVTRTEATLAEARIIAEKGIDAARQYVEDMRHYRHAQPARFYTEAAHAYDVLEAAIAAAKRNEAWWVYDHPSGQKMLFVVSLAPDPSNAGYLPLTEVKTDSDGVITHYMFHDASGEAWETVKPSIIHDVGIALYGDQWQSDMARELNVSDRTVRRWASGANPLPAGVKIDLERLCKEHAEALSGMADRLKTL